jgi:hypothetical protein
LMAGYNRFEWIRCYAIRQWTDQFRRWHLDVCPMSLVHFDWDKLWCSQHHVIFAT